MGDTLYNFMLTCKPFRHTFSPPLANDIPCISCLEITSPLDISVSTIPDTDTVRLINVPLCTVRGWSTNKTITLTRSNQNFYKWFSSFCIYLLRVLIHCFLLFSFYWICIHWPHNTCTLLLYIIFASKVHVTKSIC